MGCIKAKMGAKTPAEQVTMPRPVAKITSGQGSNQQGVLELKANYFIGSDTTVLGAGAFGRVFHTKNKHNTSFEVAIKVMDKVKLKENMDNVMEEIAILHHLDHPNIVKYYETYNDKKYIYLVMEYISGQPLF